MKALKLLLVVAITHVMLLGDTLLSPVDDHFAKSDDIVFYCNQDIVIAVAGNTEMKVIWNNPYKKNKVEVLRCKDFNVWVNLNE